MPDDLFSFKNILSLITVPLTFLLGLAGFHYKSIHSKIESTAEETNKLQILVHEHNVHVSHLNKSVNKLEHKIDSIINKLNMV